MKDGGHDFLSVNSARFLFFSSAASTLCNTGRSYDFGKLSICIRPRFFLSFSSCCNNDFVINEDAMDDDGTGPRKNLINQLPIREVSRRHGIYWTEYMYHRYSLYS